MVRCFAFENNLIQENSIGIFLASIVKGRHISPKLGNLPNPPLAMCDIMTEKASGVRL